MTNPFPSATVNEGDGEMKVLIALTVIVHLVFAQSSPIDVLFEDDFNDGNADGWLHLMPEGCYYVNDEYRYQLSYSGCGDIDPGVIRGDSTGLYMSTNDYSVVLEGVGHAPSDYIGIFLRGTLAQTGYALWLRYDYNLINIFRHDGFGNWTNLVGAHYPLTEDELYWIHFECDGSQLRAKVWSEVLSPEPVQWLLTANDCTYGNYGFMGFVTGRYNSDGDSNAQVDNVVVTSLNHESQVPDNGDMVLESTTWGGIKSMF